MDSPQSEPRFGNYYEIEWLKDEGFYVQGIVWNFSPDKKERYAINIIERELDFGQTSFRFIAHSWRQKTPEVVITREFWDLPESFQTAFLWHEIGHIHYRHFLTSTVTKSQAEIRMHRISYIDKGKVLPEELEADVFAVQRVGKQALIEALTYLKDTRPLGKRGSNNDYGTRELKFRIRKINEMKD
jgi:hypothetical protein